MAPITSSSSLRPSSLAFSFFFSLSLLFPQVSKKTDSLFKLEPNVFGDLKLCCVYTSYAIDLVYEKGNYV